MKSRPIKMISWNVNGLRAIMKKDFAETVSDMNPDILAIQETKLQEDQRSDEMINLNGYHSFWSYAETKKGYSGVATFCREEPESVNYKTGVPEFDNEGRMVEVNFKDYTMLNIYFPNGQKDETRLKYKLDFYQNLFDYLEPFKRDGRPIVITGDYNTAHNEIDLKRPKENQNTSGFMRIERDWIDKIIEMGYIDTFRHLYPDTVKYSWWSYRFNARKNNTGWRIDYFFVTENIVKNNWLKDAFIENDIFGSDHCPVGITLEI